MRTVAGALSEFGRTPRRAELAAAVLTHFERAYSLLEQDRADKLLDQYRSRLCCLGKSIKVIGPAETYQADCIDLDDNGFLLVRDEAGQTRTLSSGEISIRF